MAQKTIHSNTLAFFQETTPCVAPANWASDATWIEHISCDVSGIKQTFVADPTLEGRAFRVGTREARKGLRNASMSVVTKLHGVGVQTADATQVAQTYLGSILGHTLGGVHRGTRHAVAGGDAVEVELAAVTGIIPGCVLAFEDTTSPTEANEGRLHPRTVLSITGSVVTLSMALPFTPAAGDVAWPAITGYLVADTLVDAFAGPTTWQWFVRKARAGTDLLWQLEGSVASLKIDGLGRGALPQLQLDIQSCNFKHSGEDDLANPSPTTFQGHAQLSNGMDVVCLIGEYDDDTLVSHDANSVSFEPGFTRVRVESSTEKIARAQGTATYSFNPGESKFSVTLTPYGSSWYAGLKAGKQYQISYYQPGDGSGAGKGWALIIGRAFLLETPARADLNENHAVTLQFKCMESENRVGGSNEDLECSRFVLALF